MRIGDRERRRAEERLRASYLRGELSAETFEGRLGVAFGARHAAELDPLDADLPSLLDRLRMLFGRRARPGGPALVVPPAITGTRLILGRSHACDVRFVEASVSRDHAELRRTEHGWLVVDRGSTNGTFVNGVRVQRAPVGDGDRLELGGAELVLRI